MDADTQVQPCLIPFRYPWSDKTNDVYGLRIKRIVSFDSSPTLVATMDKKTQRPETPEVKCVTVELERIDDHRFLETSTWIPMI